MKLEVLVASHKKVDVKLPDYCQMIQVGSAFHDRIDGYIHDDTETGNTNISAKNESYCELTALYYLWKYCDADIKGLFQYRRYFWGGKPLSCNRCRPQKQANTVDRYCLTEMQIKDFLQEYDVIIETPYFPGNKWTAREDLGLYCFDEDIEKLDKVIETQYPDYLDTYHSAMSSNHLSYCNMIIAKKNILDDYCAWLFDVLERCEEVIDISSYDLQHKRIYGYFAEVLMNIYLRHHHLKEKYVPIFYAFEYAPSSSQSLWLRWRQLQIIQWFGKIGVPLPMHKTQLNTRLMKECDQWLKE